MIFVRLLPVFLMLLAVGCGERRDGQDEGIRAAVAAYARLLADGYRAMNMNGLVAVATAEQATRAYHHMAALGEGLVAMDSELMSSRCDQVLRPGNDRAEAVLQESWRYRYLDVRTGVAGEYFPVNYTVRYFLVRQEEGRWLVDRIEVLDADRALADDKLPFFQRPPGQQAPGGY